MAEALAATLYPDGLKTRDEEWWENYASRVVAPNRWLQQYNTAKGRSDVRYQLGRLWVGFLMKGNARKLGMVCDISNIPCK